MIKNFLKGKYTSNRIVPNSNFLKISKNREKIGGFIGNLNSSLERTIELFAEQINGLVSI